MKPEPIHVTNNELKRIIRDNPAWLGTATPEQPIIVMDYCDLTLSEVSTLSPHAEFHGRNNVGKCAEFLGCDNLKIAEGIFHGMADFTQSGVERIGELSILQPDNMGNAVRFRECEHLKEARGTYPGFANFGKSAIVRITDLKVTSTNEWKLSADFSECKNLQVARGSFDGAVGFKGSGIKEVKDLWVAYVGNDPPRICLRECDELIRCPKEIYNDPMVDIEPATIGKIMANLNRERRARNSLKAPPLEL